MTRVLPAVVLFDLDGTLIDSAPDLGGAGNEMRVARSLPELPLEQFRPLAGAGARGMVGVALGVAPGDEGFTELRDEFLRRYEARLLQRTRVFAPVGPVLDRLDGAGIRWGIVTNKHSRYTMPVVQGLALHERAAVVISGDTTPHAKPHPAPLLEAARRLDVVPGACVYVGDDLRDVQAGRAAGMTTLVAAWGYIGDGEMTSGWGADAVVDSPGDVLNWLGLT